MATAPAVRAADYVVITKEVEVDRPVEVVWRRVGDYGAISEWMQTDCGYLSGDGGVGTVRRLLRGEVTEVMIAQTSRSYSFVQTRGKMAFANLHGTLAAEPIEASRTRLVYTLIYDQTAFAAEADRRAQRERLDERHQHFLEVMKTMAEAEPVVAPSRRASEPAASEPAGNAVRRRLRLTPPSRRKQPAMTKADDYAAVVPLLKSAAPDFPRSYEYALVADHDDLPGVILAAYARFLIRTSTEASVSDAAEGGIGTINALYEANDPQVRAAIRDEFIEMFEGEPAAVRTIQPFLSPPLAHEFAKVLG